MREDVRVAFGREATCDEQCYYMHLFATQFPPTIACRLARRPRHGHLNGALPRILAEGRIDS